MVRFMTPAEAVACIKDDDTLATGGFVRNGVPEALLIALERRFLTTGAPRDLTLVYAAGQGDGKDEGLNHLGHEGLLRRIIGGHWNLCPRLGELAVADKVEAYNLPQGIISHMYRDIAAGNPATISHVGLKTFVDPRLDGGKINKVTTEDLVELITIQGQEQLLYKTFPLNVCLLRGTAADEKGNITLEHEGVTLDTTTMAQAVRNSGGTVIVQVENLVQAGSLDPRLVKLPHIYVDIVVVLSPDENRLEAHPVLAQACSGEIRVPATSLAPIPLDERKIIARRAAMELVKDSVVNLGIGVPEAIAAVATEEGIGDYMTLTVESGPVGGIPAGGTMFGLAVNPDCLLDQDTQFVFYDGGGLDLAFLGLAECDHSGNVNVSKMGSRVTGAGGFINITQNAKRLYFCGTFTAKGLRIATDNGSLRIVAEGQARKFLDQVAHVTFSGEYAREKGQPVLYITERAVFELRDNGLHLTEIAPSIDLDHDILGNMDFVPHMDQPPRLMEQRLFQPDAMGLSGGA